MDLGFHRAAMFALLSGALLAQAPEINTTETAISFSTGVNLVAVKVVVRDKNGKTVGDLKQSDFELRDTGKVQTIARFSVEQAQALTPRVVAVPADGAGRERPDLAPPSQREPVAIPERFIAYIFDDVHTDIRDLTRSREEAVKHLERALDPATRIAVFTTSGTVLQDFTDDIEALTKTMRKISRWSADAESDRNDCPPLNYYWAHLILNLHDPEATKAALDEARLCAGSRGEDFMRTAARRKLAEGQRNSGLGLGMITEVVRRMTAKPGQRSIVYISSGFLVEPNLRFRQIDVFDKAIRANVIVNTLDARGLYAVIPGDPSRRAPASVIFSQRFERDLAFVSTNVMAELASATGGKFVWNSNDYQAGLDMLAATPEYTYVLAFSPKDVKADGSFHKLKVTLKNKKGLEVLARSGYFAPTAEANSEEAVREEVREALYSRDELSDIPIDLSLEYFKQDERMATLTVLAKLDVTALKFRRAANRNNVILTVVSAVFDRNGNFVKGVQRVVDMKLTDQTLDRLRDQGGLAVRTNLDLEPGGYLVRLVVRDSAGKTMASRNGAVEIPY